MTIDNPIFFTDGYKLDHRRQYPQGTTLVYSNWTARKSRLDQVDEVVFFGLQYFIKKYLIPSFQKDFFSKPKQEVLDSYQAKINAYLPNNHIDLTHIESLHDLGYLPIVIKALPEGVSVPLKVPMMTIYNTKPEFFWLTNYLETLISTTIWMSCTSATIAKSYRKILNNYAKYTSSDLDMVAW